MTTTTTTMKAARVSQFLKEFTSTEIRTNVTMQEIDRPQLAKTNSILIKVLACSLSPGDMVRTAHYYRSKISNNPVASQ